VRRLSLLALEFVAITAPLTWLWIEWGREAYHEIFIEVTRPMVAWFGIPNAQLGHAPQRFISYVPFIALMVITPGLTLERRVFGTVIGFGVLFLSHAAFVLASIAAYMEYGETPRAIRAVFPVMLLLDSLPFILWAVIAHEVVREWAAKASRRIFGEDPSGSGGDSGG